MIERYSIIGEQIFDEKLQKPYTLCEVKQLLNNYEEILKQSGVKVTKNTPDEYEWKDVMN